ncbi:decarboxylase [candidate division GN15 bacterium]|nr:decarboxylase [candidate division GN15 bacterium]
MTRIIELAEHKTPQLERHELESFVRSFQNRREEFLSLVNQYGSPLYVIDESALRRRAREFLEAFDDDVPGHRAYYALKSNNHPTIASILLSEGYGLDVSSGEELSLALSLGAQDIIFSGPGKTVAELELAVRHSHRVTVLMDSIGELERLELIAARLAQPIRTGVRLTTDDEGIWRKFGIPLDSLRLFMTRAARCKFVTLRGLQFHMSWNLSPDNQVVFIARLGAALRELDRKQRGMIEFIDVGGGYWPPRGEWLQERSTPAGRLRYAVEEQVRPRAGHYRLPAAPIMRFAQHIARALKTQVLADVTCAIYTEPGRWLSHEAMHLLLRVVDRKADDLVITDAGANAIGWERFEYDYFPVINLSRPAPVEHDCYVMGSLCTPHDLWGYSYFGEDVQPGDVLLIPTQGAYTYSLRQHFIKALPTVVSLPPAGTSTSAAGDAQSLTG